MVEAEGAAKGLIQLIMVVRTVGMELDRVEQAEATKVVNVMVADQEPVAVTVEVVAAATEMAMALDRYPKW